MILATDLLAPEKIEENLRKAVYELGSLEELAKDVQGRINMVDAVLREIGFSRLTTQGLESLKENDEIMVPIGGGSYLLAKIADTSKVIVGVGANVAIEKTGKEALDYIDRQVDELGRSRSSLQEQLSQIVDRMEKLRTEAQQLSSSLEEASQDKTG